jgi:hypothetical protein
MMLGKIPKYFFTKLTDQYKYKIMGVVTPTYHLGGDSFHDKYNILAWVTSLYFKKIITNYKIVFNELPPESSLSMTEKDHLELDLTNELDPDGIKKYQSLIGILQWLVTIGRSGILVGVTNLVIFRTSPRIGHLDRLKRINGYISKYPDGSICFRTGRLNHEAYTTPGT